MPSNDREETNREILSNRVLAGVLPEIEKDIPRGNGKWISF